MRATARFPKVALIGLLIGVIGGGVGIVVAVFAVFAPNMLTSLAGKAFGFVTPETRPVDGDPATFDPVRGYAGALAFAGEGAKLIAIEASQVRRDGTSDLTASYRPAPDVEYKFIRVVPRPKNAPPIGAGGTEEDRWFEPITIRAFEPGQRRRITQRGEVNATYTIDNKGMMRSVDPPAARYAKSIEAPAPSCSFTEFWKHALAQGAPADAVARISYDARGYRFAISGTKVWFEFDRECRKIR